MSNVLDNFINRLSDNYNKDPGGNVHKLMQLTTKAIQENEDGYFAIMNWRDVDQAEGKVLDRIGGNLEQDRGQLPDETYRVLIKAKAKRSLSDGSIDTLIDFLSFILQIPTTEVLIKELWPEGKHAALHVNVPAGAINKTGLSFAQFGRLINMVVVAGVRAEALFEGTFSFSSDYYNSEVDDEKGFADDAQTIGGTFGYIYDPVEDIELPI